jgi:hypothetical protein
MNSDITVLVTRFYDSISFTAGGAPNWDVLASLFHESAVIIPPASDTGGKLSALFLPEFVAHFRPVFESMRADGFTEYELFDNTSLFGDVAQRSSGYAITHGGKAVPFRGMNMFQLVRTDGEWSIASLVWDRVSAS